VNRGENDIPYPLQEGQGCHAIFSDCAVLPKFPIVLAPKAPMNEPTPHYLLMSEASRTEKVGRWRFVLKTVDGSAGLEVADVEPDVWGERLDLLTVVRALESLDQPSRVTLLGCTRYVEQGIQYGLEDWKENDWRWECFGQMVTVRDADLWRRMDRILQFHQVECSQRRIDLQHNLLEGHHWDVAKKREHWVDSIAGANWLKCYGPLLACWHGFLAKIASCWWPRGFVCCTVQNDTEPRVIGNCFHSDRSRYGVRGRGARVGTWWNAAFRFRLPVSDS